MKLILLLFIICLGLSLNTAFATDTKRYSVETAFKLYSQHSYTESANAFDQILSSSTVNASLCYYAALANMQCHRTARSNQLFSYIVTNFPKSPEAVYAQKVLNSQTKDKQTVQANSQETELPEAVKNALPTEMRALLNTKEGKAAVLQAMKEQQNNLQTIKKAEAAGQSSPSAPSQTRANNGGAGKAQPFSAADIAKDGAGGIDQSRYPNCWFEASMSALAQLPRGQRLLADTIHYGPTGGYIVRFKNDGVEYKISEDDIASSGIHDKALWASILECAETQKFPNNAGANGSDNDQSRLEVGLGSITGCRAEVINPASCDIQELSAFIGSAVKSQNPIVAATYSPVQLAGMPALVVSNHAYTIIDLDPSKQMVTIRNPHGSRSRPFQLSNDPQHLQFEQFNDGVFKMSLSNVQKYFHSIARSFI